MENLSKYNKFIVAVVGFAVIAVTSYYGDTQPQWLEPLIALLTSLGVYQVANKE